MATMKAELSALKLWQLKHWAFLIGMPSTGTKTHLVDVLAVEGNTKSIRQRAETITSVDLGIRNFAYCTVVAPAFKDCHSRWSGTVSPLRVVDWKRLDIMARSSVQGEIPTDSKIDAAQSVPQSIAKDAISESVAFTLPLMSRAAYDLTKDLIANSPDKILIERQFLPRGPGARATSEWTLRINKLEGMLWACLESLRNERDPDSSSFPSVHAVNPDRIATFWASGRNVSLRPTQDLLQSNKIADKHEQPAKSSIRKLSKTDKVAIVRSWTSGSSEVPIQFEGQAALVAKAFMASRRKDGETVAGGKLDDLADCLLQAVAWLHWDENRRTINHMWQSMLNSSGRDQTTRISR